MPPPVAVTLIALASNSKQEANKDRNLIILNFKNLSKTLNVKLVCKFAQPETSYKFIWTFRHSKRFGPFGMIYVTEGGEIKGAVLILILTSLVFS